MRSPGGGPGIAGSSADSDLRRLRRRLTALFVTTAAIVMLLFVLMLVTTSTALERRRLDSDLTGAASRATALIYDDEAGRTRVEGVVDDRLAESGMPMLVVQLAGEPPGGTVLLDLGAPDRATALDLARRAAAGPMDSSTFGSVTVDGRPRRAVAMPWIHDDDSIGGAVTVAAAADVGLSSNWLLLPAVGGGAGVLALLTVMAWLIAGRSLRPAAEALADRERFLSTAAHELRGPLARLRAGAEAARRAVRPGEAAAEALSQLVVVADSAAHVVSNLLLATKAEHDGIPLRRQAIDLAALAGELEHVHPAILVDVREPVPVSGDPALLRHALNNLVDNSYRYGRVGQALPTVDVQVTREGGHAVIRVSDDGPGFPPDVDVLARYAVGPGGGTGLGLPLVRWIVERHGGTMSLGERTVGGGWGAGGGALVELVLPLATAPSPPTDGVGDAGGDGQVAMSTKRE